jgi:hypothetical protein
LFVSCDLGSAAFTEEPGRLGGFQAYSLEDLEPDWLEAPAAADGEAEDDLESPEEEDAGFFLSEEAEAAPAGAGPAAEVPAAGLAEAGLAEESPEFDFELDGAAGFLPLESFT